MRSTIRFFLNSRNLSHKRKHFLQIQWKEGWGKCRGQVSCRIDRTEVAVENCGSHLLVFWDWPDGLSNVFVSFFVFSLISLNCSPLVSQLLSGISSLPLFLNHCLFHFFSCSPSPSPLNPPLQCLPLAFPSCPLIFGMSDIRRS